MPTPVDEYWKMAKREAENHIKKELKRMEWERAGEPPPPPPDYQTDSLSHLGPYPTCPEVDMLFAGLMVFVVFMVCWGLTAIVEAESKAKPEPPKVTAPPEPVPEYEFDTSACSPYQQGRDAYRWGLSPLDNPYIDFSEEWLQGFLDAQEEEGKL